MLYYSVVGCNTYRAENSLSLFSCDFISQLAILASYSGDDLVSIYRYFRSLAADIPFSTARDNLIIAFEKVLLPLLPNNHKMGMSYAVSLALLYFEYASLRVFFYAEE